MNRFFTQEPVPEKGDFTFHGDQVKHMKQVLRLMPGEQIVLCNGAGREYSCSIVAYEEGEVKLRILDARDATGELPGTFVLFQGIPKGDKMDLIIQKMVELGVAAIVPLLTARTVVRLEDERKEEKKRKRWQTIAENAACQSGRGILPKILPARSFTQGLDYAKQLDCGMIPYECATGMKEWDLFTGERIFQKSVGIFIGPEGGFEEAEVQMAKEAGIVPISLGHRILRTETAGFTAQAILMHSLERYEGRKEDAHGSISG